MKNIITAFIHILFQYLTYVYLHKFEELNCACAMDVRRDIAKAMLSVMWVFVIGKLLFQDVPVSVQFFMLIFAVIYDYVFVSYIFKVKKCACKNTTQMQITNIFYYYWLLIILSTILMVTFFILYTPVASIMSVGKN